MTISVLVGEKGRHLMERVQVIGKVDTLHEIVRLAYMDAQSYLDADLIVELVDGLRPICSQELLPKTRLLLARMPAMARKMRTDQAIPTAAPISACRASGGHLGWWCGVAGRREPT